MKDFSESLKSLPEGPGVYLMFDDQGTIIYVGKAINLRRRVRSYFVPSPQAKTPKVLAMVEHIDHFEYILASSEVEALVLESNFIKEHAPKYNILLRDDKQYPLIKVTREKFPRLLKVRQIADDGASYFGPYPNAYAVNDIIRLLQRVYGIRTCNLDFDQGKTLSRPCLNFFIGQCPGPCVGKADEEAYLTHISEIKDFLKGKDKPIRAMLEEKMKEASDSLHFERAAHFRDDLYHLDELKERQKVTFTHGADADFIALARGDAAIMVEVFFVRDGKVVDRVHFSMDAPYQEDSAEIISSFLKQFYAEAAYIPGEILVESSPPDRAALEAFLSERMGRKVRIRVPQRGDKKELLATVRDNAEEAFLQNEKRKDRRERNREKGILALEEFLGGKTLSRIEAYDISNLSGVQNVGSMVVYDREKKNPKEYRKFRIRTVEGPDDYASQREMLSRRFDHGLRDRALGKKAETGFALFPSLILMDGGKGQVHLAEEILRDRGLSIPVAGLVKDDKHQTRAIFYEEKEWPLERTSALYRFLYGIQEEVHRFAISYHRDLRKKEMVRSELDEIQGIGKKRRLGLLRAFGSLERIRKASAEELAQAEAMTPKAAQKVYDHFHSKAPSPAEEEKPPFPPEETEKGEG